MTEYLTNLGKAPARPEHLGRCGVPETMSTDRRQSGPFAGMPDDGGDALAREPTMRGADHVNTDWSAHRGRPRRSQPTTASPTSTGTGRRSSRFPLPRTTISPLRQSMSASLSLATSPARSPRRDRTNRTAKSRRPVARRRSQLLNILATSLGGIAFGNEARRQLATEGTAPASSFEVRPTT